MKQNYDACLARVLKDEGGYTNDPVDPGGPTNFGITIADYRKYINKAGVALDVKRMDLNDAKAIYKSKYWNALNCDNLSSGVDYTCFDYGVNSGLGRPRKALQRFKSLKGTYLIDAINNERTAFLRALGTFPRFGKGWIRRVEGVRAFSKELAKKDTKTGPVIGTGTVIAGTTLSQYFHTHQTAIIIGSIVIAVLIGVAVYLFKNKGKL